MDPVSITVSAYTILTVITKASLTLTAFINDAEVANETLEELRSDLKVLYDLIDNINRLFKVPAFTQAIQAIQKESQINLFDCLVRALQNCSVEVQKLADILSEFGFAKAESRIRKGILQFRLDQRKDDINKLKQNFQGHKTSINTAFAILNT